MRPLRTISEHSSDADGAIVIVVLLANRACRLPNDAGLIYKVLGRDSAQVKAKVREFWAVAREEITGAALPPQQYWR